MIATSEILSNPGLLKLELMRRGLKVSPEVLGTMPRPGFGPTGHALFGSAGDIDLVLPKNTWASVPVGPRLVRDSPYHLIHREGAGHAVTVALEDGALSGPIETAVTIRPASRFFDHVTQSGIRLGQVGTVHGPYLALSPTRRCTFLGSAQQCRFCGVSGAIGPDDAVPAADIVEAIRVARDEHPVSMVHLSVGYLGTEDGGVRLLEPIIGEIKKHFDVLVAVDALPPKDNGWIDRTYGIGADAVSYNLEIWDEERFSAICPGPAQEIGRDRFLEAMSYATTVFPSGGVTCHLIVGLEPLASTREGMIALAEMGVVPVLPVYRPFKGRDLRADVDVERFPPDLSELAELYADLYQAVRKNKLGLSLVRDLAVVTTPLEGRFFTGPEGVFRSLANRVAGSRLGRKTSARLSDLRRALRVREVAPAPE